MDSISIERKAKTIELITRLEAIQARTISNLLLERSQLLETHPGNSPQVLEFDYFIYNRLEALRKQQQIELGKHGLLFMFPTMDDDELADQMWELAPWLHLARKSQNS